jgi:hypothetical protein
LHIECCMIFAVEHHAQLAAILEAPTVFRMLNDPGRMAGPQQFSIAERGEDLIAEDLALASLTIKNSSPGGVTPLIGHLHEIHAQVAALECQLRATGSKVAIVLATDGIPTDEQGHTSAELNNDFTAALRKFEGLPVQIVIRLCTDNDSVVEFWNYIDDDLDLSLEVLDDFIGEAQEIYQFQKWLNYGLPLHRMREMGFHDDVFDNLDESKLTIDELYIFFQILFGRDKMLNVTEPEVDFDEFVSGISKLLAKERKQWNPISKRTEPWVNISTLRKEYGPFSVLNFFW